MDLQKYFAELATHLVAGGMSEAQSKAYCKRLMTSLAALDDKAKAEKMANYGDAEDLAKRVLAIAAKTHPAEEPSAEGDKAEQPKGAALEHTVNAGGAPIKKRDDVTRPIPTVKENEPQNEKPQPPPDVLQATRKKIAPVKVATDSEKPEKKPLSKRGMAVFFGTAALTSPITLTLAAALIGLFLLVHFALVFIAVAMLLAVTVTVICGILLALVCLGYGIVMMLPGTTAFFIGLYEFGLGLIIVGGTIVFPILEYNCATLLVPFTMKKWNKLLKFVIRQIKRLVVYLYDLCRDL